MSSALRTREQQRASSEAAILDAAVTLYGNAGPDGASLRDVAQTVGLTHALVSRYFGSKRGLIAAVGDHLTEHVTAEVESVNARDAAGFTELLRSARDDRSMTRLLVRSALGDLQPDGFPGCLGGPWLRSSASGDTRIDDRARICQYGASSLLLGWLTFDGFLRSAVRLARVSDRRLDRAMAAAAARLWDLTATSEPALEPRQLAVGPRSRQPSAQPGRAASDALLESAIELFAHQGPASVSIRDIARHAGVNHGLVHRHFGSKDNLLAKAIEAGASSLLPGALASGGFDIDDVVHAMHHESTAPRLIARTLVDDIAIASVRRRYPVMRGLLAAVQQVPAESRPPELADPRFAAAAASALVGGSAIWGPVLRETIGLLDDDGVDSAIADLARHLLGLPNVSDPSTTTMT